MLGVACLFLRSQEEHVTGTYMQATVGCLIIQDLIDTHFRTNQIFYRQVHVKKTGQNELDEIIILHARFEFMTPVTLTTTASIFKVQAVLR